MEMGFDEMIKLIMEAVKQFGFPMVVAGWALWRLDKNWAKGDNIQSRLDQIEEGLDRIEMTQTKQAEIQQEMLLTLKILHTVSITNNGGGNK
jgi:hypothetical protein